MEETQWEVVTGPAYGTVAEPLFEVAFTSPAAALQAIRDNINALVEDMDELSPAEEDGLRSGLLVVVDHEDGTAEIGPALVVVQPAFLLS